jgi:putative transposase
MQELIETEATQQIGAGRYERAETRVTDRNGSRARLVATQASDVRLRIPKLRKGSFFPAILEPRRRIDQALYAVVMEAYVNGVSTRAVDDLVAALGIESGISKSEVSRICAGLDEQVEAFRSRPLHHGSAVVGSAPEPTESRLRTPADSFAAPASRPTRMPGRTV